MKSIKPLSFTDYNYLQMNACLTFSDSGTINEEVSVLKFKAINIRDTERPEAMEGNVTPFISLKSSDFIDKVDSILTESSEISNIEDYDCKNVSQKIVNIIMSYTHLCTKYIWNK